MRRSVVYVKIWYGIVTNKSRAPDGRALAHGLRRLQQWNAWLNQEFLGTKLLKTETSLLTSALERHLGKQALIIGVPHQLCLLQYIKLPCHSLVTPLSLKKEHMMGFIEGDLHELPIMTGSVELVVIPHTLEFIDNPQKLLHEACRVVKPEGLIAIFGFNPFSMWGLRKVLHNKNLPPWNANSIQAYKIKNWLRLADFEMETHKSALFVPPIKHQAAHKKLQFMETVGNKFLPLFGGIYILIARAKVIPLTPIKLKWKQQLSNIRINTISGHIAR